MALQDVGCKRYRFLVTHLNNEREKAIHDQNLIRDSITSLALGIIPAVNPLAAPTASAASSATPPRKRL